MAKRILDEETKQKLRGSLPFSSSVTIDCTLVVSDLPDFNPVFTVRSFTKKEEDQVAINKQALPLVEATRGQIADIADKNLEVIRDCISGWKNLVDIGTGEEIEFVASPSGGCEKIAYSKLPRWMIVELFLFIQKLSSIEAPEGLSIK
jgi:hypothetical protein